VLLFSLKDGTPSKEDVQAFRKAMGEFKKTAPGVPVRGVYVAAQPAPFEDPAAKTGADAPYTVVEISRLEAGLDRLLEEVRRDNFIRLTGTTLELVRTDPSTLLARGPA